MSYDEIAVVPKYAIEPDSTMPDGYSLVTVCFLIRGAPGTEASMMPIESLVKNPMLVPRMVAPYMFTAGAAEPVRVSVDGGLHWYESSWNWSWLLPTML